MDSNVLRFDFEEMARLAKDDPEGFAQKRGALIRQLIDRAPRKEQLTELQSNLDQTCLCYQLAAPSLQLGLHVTNMMLRSVSFMTTHLNALNGLMRNDSARSTHERVAE